MIVADLTPPRPAMDQQQPGDVLIHLRPLGDHPAPVPVRLRHLLKQALRAHGFKAVSVTEAQAPALPSPDADQGDLKAFALALAERVASQSELLSRRAERLAAATE